ncbi:hypothetical protein [Tomitella gaofuii]|uniref:hypothetical protein n=1 Tax=Tomitella gaofuii TaxID=2760083 RepID=UPI0015F811DA|nr:hypothetical protein [Tomitella gaofuii]
MQIINATGTYPASYAADIARGQQFVARLISTTEHGVQTLRLRDLDTRAILAEHTTEQGHTLNMDEVHAWAADHTR